MADTNLSEEQLREAITAILKATDGVFQIAAVHGYKWEGGSLVEPIMALIATSNNKLIQSIEDKLPDPDKMPAIIMGGGDYANIREAKIAYKYALTEVTSILESMKEK